MQGFFLPYQATKLLKIDKYNFFMYNTGVYWKRFSMKKYSPNLIGLCILSGILGCVAPSTKDFIRQEKSEEKASDPDLTLIKKEVPRYQSFPFERGELYFSTNQSQQTHAILSRYLCPDTFDVLRNAPEGKTMKQNDWEKYLMSDKICPTTKRTHFNNLQKFYQ